MGFHSHSQFKKQIRRLSHLYDFAMYSMESVRIGLLRRVRDGAIDLSHHIRSQYGFVSEHSVNLLIGHTRTVYPETLRSALLVRAVSAFEVLLIQMIREVSTRSLVPFMSDTPVQLAPGLLLSLPDVDSLRDYLVTREIRNLTSGGFQEICRYYRKILGIDLAQSPVDMSSLSEMHERRHLHVHRAGHADDAYRKRFAPDLRPDEYLPIDEEYLHTAFDALAAVAEYVATEASARFPERAVESLNGTKSSLADGDYLYFIRATFPGQGEAQAHLASRTIVTDSEEHVDLASILVSALIDQSDAEWAVGGPRRDVGPYIGYLHRLHSSGYLSVLKCRRLKQGSRT